MYAYLINFKTNGVYIHGTQVKTKLIQLTKRFIVISTASEKHFLYQSTVKGS